MIICPKCGVEGKYYYDGSFISCEACGHREVAKLEKDGKLTDLYQKWSVPDDVSRNDSPEDPNNGGTEYEREYEANHWSA